MNLKWCTHPKESIFIEDDCIESVGCFKYLYNLDGNKEAELKIGFS